MINKVLLLLLFASYTTYCQNSKDGANQNKFSAGIHYTYNFKNQNFFSSNYSGVLGLDFRYDIVSKNKLAFYGGIAIDYFKEKSSKEYNYFDYKNTLILNPNVGIDYNVFNSKLRPFFNLGLGIYNIKYTIPFASLINYDPIIQPYTSTTVSKTNYAISFQPGLRYKDRNWFVETSYKYLPQDSNVNIHLFTIGGGVRF